MVVSQMSQKLQFEYLKYKSYVTLKVKLFLIKAGKSQEN